MKTHPAFRMVMFVAISVLLCSFANLSSDPLNGTWIRKSDHLRINIKAQDEHTHLSFISADGYEKFPCDVSALPIYKNIKTAGRNLWYCEFLVVTMGSCATDYEEGIIQLMKNGDLEITCPGYEKKIYQKALPRLDLKP